MKPIESPNAALARWPDAGELLELAERELRLVSYELESIDHALSQLARADADVVAMIQRRWGKP